MSRGRRYSLILEAVLFCLLLSTSCTGGSNVTGSVAVSSSGKPCAPGCTARGNCNIEDGRCECAIGFSGPTCEHALLAACQASPKDMPFWGVFMPKNCECYRQAAEFFTCTKGRQKDCQVSIYQAKLSGSRCYTFDGKPASEQWSDYPPIGTPGISWHNFHDDMSVSPISEEQGRKAVNMWGHDLCRPQPLPACPGNCTSRGTCIKDCIPNVKRDAWCECHKGYSGDSCEHVDEALCLNRCSGRGACIRGFCHCQAPWFGLDCSRTKGFPDRPDNVPTRTKPLIYMYELPHSVSAPVELDDNLPDHVIIYSSYIHFLEIFLKDWAVRTEDPWEANLFYIPAFTYSYSSNVGDPAPHLISVVKYIQQTYPFYNRTGGKDHFMWFTGDHGACEAPTEAASLIKLVHFGYHMNERIQGPSIMGRQPKDPVNGCFHPARDIVSAPYNSLGFEDAKYIYDQIVRGKGHAPNRSNLFFFAGGIRKEQKHYSGGVRQAINELLLSLANKTDGGDMRDIIFIEGGTEKYRELYNTTKFCLAPHGSGFGIRLSIAMVHGCIPVVIQDHVFQPFEGLIPYEDMGVRIAKRDIPDLIPILRAISEEEQARMRLRMAEHYRAFIWEPDHGGLAYNYTISSLYKRLHAMWGELYKRKQHRRLKQE